MLKIAGLKLKNFKSFKKAEIPFANGFTAIAGANASGKSNVLDSLMFVFGITSLKMLRASKLSELINHDAREDYAKVEIDLKDNDKIYNISRIIDKKGQSSLRLNGKKKNLGEIASLLQELGIKPTGHNIVVQGDVTKVIQMNAKQRREILDDVAGLMEFEQKKVESIRKLEQVEERIKDANLVLNERKNYLEELEKEKIAAQQFNSLTKELKQSKATIIFNEIKRNKEQVAEVDGKISALQEEIEKKEKLRKELLEQENPLEEKIENLTKKMIETSETTYSTIVREIEEKKAETSVLREKIEEKKLHINMLKEKISTLKEEKNSLNNESDEKNEKIKALTTKIEEDRVSWQKLKELIDEKSSSLKSKNLESLEGNARELSIQGEQIQSKLFDKKLLKEKKSREKELNEKMVLFLSQEQKKLEELLSEKNNILSQIKEINIIEPEISIESKEKEIDSLLSSIHSLKSQANQLRDSTSKLKSIDSACPVCDQKIEATTINNLLLQRENRLKETNIEIQKKSEENEKKLQEKQSLIHKLHTLHDLKSNLSGFTGSEQKFEEIKTKINEAREKIKLLGIESIIEEEKQLSGSLESVIQQKNDLLEKINLIKKSSDSVKLDLLLDKFNEITEQKNQKENSLSVLKIQVEESIKNRLEVLYKEKNSSIEQLGSYEKTLLTDEQKLVESGKELAARETKMQKATQASRLLEDEKNRLTTKLKNIEEKREALDLKISRKEKDINELKISKSKNDIRLADLKEEFNEFEGTITFKDAEVTDLRKRISEIESQVKKLGAINMKALEKFSELKKEVDDVRQKADKLDFERKAVLELIDKIELKKIHVFMECFNAVSKKFSDIYFHFFGGEGKLSLSDPQNPTDGGLQIEAKYKEDKLKSIDAMSGGEKSLTALAFIFAIQTVDPAPFYIFDEADAALDKENSLKLGKMIKEISKNSQFISITHNDSIVKEADQIIGVALNKQKSSVIGLRLKGKIAI